MSKHHVLLTLSLAAATPTAVPAAWTANGPDGGFVAAVVGSGNNLIAATSDGVYATNDAAASWHRIGDLPRGLSIGWLAASPADPQVMLAAASPAYRTTDGGQHWTALAQPLGYVLFHPLAAESVAAVDWLGHLFCSADGGQSFSDTGRLVTSVAADFSMSGSFLLGDDTGGLYRSSAGCLAWTNVASHFSFLTATSMLVNPTNPDVLLVSTNGLDQAMLESYVLSTQTNSALVYAYDAAGVIADPTTDGRLWFSAFDEVDPDVHVFESLDGGSIWNDVGAALHGGYFSGLIGADPIVAGTLYGDDDVGFAVSQDAARTWTSRTQGIPLAQTSAVSIRPDNPQEIVTATRAGIAISADAGQTWTPAASPSPPYVASLARSPADPALVFASVPNDGVYSSPDGGIHWTRVSEPAFLNFLSIAVDHADPQKLAGAFGALQWSDDGGVHWRYADVQGDADVRQIISSSGSGRYYALAFVHNDVYRLYRAQAHGAQLVPAASTLPLNALAIDPVDDDTLFAVAHDDTYQIATFYVSHDAGDHWDPRGTVPNSVSSEAFLRYDPCDPRTVYMQTYNVLYASTDEGMTWTQESAELPVGSVKDFDVQCTAGVLAMAVATYSHGTEVRDAQFVDTVFANGFESD